MRQLTVAWMILLQTLKAKMAYRWDFLVQCLSALAAEAAGLAVILVIFGNTPSLGEWDRPQVLFIYAMAMVVQATFGLISGSFWRFASRYIIHGEFDRLLLRPVNPLLQLLLENLSLQRLPAVGAGGAILVFAAHRMDFSWTLTDAALLMCFLASGVMLLVGLFLAITTTSFWFEDRAGLGPPIFNLMAFGKYPLTVFSPTIQFILSFVVPFGFMAFYPATHFLRAGQGHNEFRVFCYLTPAVGLLVFGIGYLAWECGIRAYRSTGS